jgi:signal transduction histidine kinase
VASRVVRATAWVAALALGTVAEAAGPGFRDPAQWLPDLVVGMALVTAALLRLDRTSRGTAVLLGIAGGAWFLGTVLAAAIYLHRAVLAHAALTFPGWRPTRRSAPVLTAAYASALIVPIGSREEWTVALGIILVATAWMNWARARGRARIERMIALRATAAFAVVLLASALVRVSLPRGDGVYSALILYELGLTALAGYLIVAQRQPSEASVVDLVVDLGDDSGGTLGGRLSSLLGDPSLQVGYWTGGAYADARGEPIEVPAGRSVRSATPVSLEGRPFAVIVHDAAVLRDSSSVEAVARATRLSESNVQLRAGVAAAVADIEESSRRLREAADFERDRLAMRLAIGPERTLATVLRSLSNVPDDLGPDRACHVELSREHLSSAIRDLREVGRGLRPAEMEAAGLRDVVERLASRSAVPVVCDVRVDNVPTDVRATIYYLCAEGLANVAKHAEAAAARIEIWHDARSVVVEIADDGCGGADERRGSGLAGMRDRLAAIGGTLDITSPVGAGTRLVIRLPLDDEAR